MSENNLRDLTGRISPLKGFPFALQQVLAMFVTNLVPVVTISAVAGLNSAMALATGVGFTTSTEAGIWTSFPVIIQSIFAQSVVAIIFLMSFFLNLVLPKDMEDKEENAGEK